MSHTPPSPQPHPRGPKEQPSVRTARTAGHRVSVEEMVERAHARRQPPPADPREALLAAMTLPEDGGSYADTPQTSHSYADTPQVSEPYDDADYLVPPVDGLDIALSDHVAAYADASHTPDDYATADYVTADYDIADYATADYDLDAFPSDMNPPTDEHREVLVDPRAGMARRLDIDPADDSQDTSHEPSNPRLAFIHEDDDSEMTHERSNPRIEFITDFDASEQTNPRVEIIGDPDGLAHDRADTSEQTNPRVEIIGAEDASEQTNPRVEFIGEDDASEQTNPRVEIISGDTPHVALADLLRDAPKGARGPVTTTRRDTLGSTHATTTSLETSPGQTLDLDLNESTNPRYGREIGFLRSASANATASTTIGHTMGLVSESFYEEDEDGRLYVTDTTALVQPAPPLTYGEKRRLKRRVKRAQKYFKKVKARELKARRKRYRGNRNIKQLPGGGVLFPSMRVISKRRFLAPRLVFDVEMESSPQADRAIIRTINPKTSLLGRLWWRINPWRARLHHNWFQTAMMRLVATTFSIGLVLTIALVGLFIGMVATAEIPEIVATKPAQLYTSDGAWYSELYSDSNRKDVPIDKLPPSLGQALIAAEDNTFRTHIGVNPVSIMRAFLANIEKGQTTQGGSTITQQYIKVARREDSPNLWRKITEAAAAIKLERTYKKDKILEMYLNNVYFGRGANGIQEAAQAYFRKDATQLTMQESAMLIGILPAPSLYDPMKNPKKTQVRYGYVLRRMVDEGYISQADMDESIYNRPLTYPPPISQTDPYPWMTDMVRRELESLGFNDGGDMTITTTLNPSFQKKMNHEYQHAFARLTSTATMVTVDNTNGEVLAAIGGKDYQEDQLNLLNLERQPGSTFKPFALMAYLERGNSPGKSFRSPAQITFEGADNGKNWVVNNYEGAGTPEGLPTTIASATATSSNTVYAQIARQVGREAVADMANRMLGRTRAHRIPANWSLVLGTTEVNPVELAGAYATIAADGHQRSPHVIKSIYRYGELLYQAPQPDTQIINPQVARMTTYMLEQVAKRGTGKRANFGRPIAVKTGTTQGHGDAWFAGFTKQYTTVVWMGNRDNRNQLPHKETGGGLPAMVWRDYMSRIHYGIPEERFTPPHWDAFNGEPLLPPKPQGAGGE